MEIVLCTDYTIATFGPPRRDTPPRMHLYFRGFHRHMYVQLVPVCTGTGTWVSGGSVGVRVDG